MMNKKKLLFGIVGGVIGGVVGWIVFKPLSIEVFEFLVRTINDILIYKLNLKLYLNPLYFVLMIVAPYLFPVLCTILGIMTGIFIQKQVAKTNTNNN